MCVCGGDGGAVHYNQLDGKLDTDWGTPPRHLTLHLLQQLSKPENGGNVSEIVDFFVVVFWLYKENEGGQKKLWESISPLYQDAEFIFIFLNNN